MKTSWQKVEEVALENENAAPHSQVVVSLHWRSLHLGSVVGLRTVVALLAFEVW